MVAYESYFVVNTVEPVNTMTLLLFSQRSFSQNIASWIAPAYGSQVVSHRRQTDSQDHLASEKMVDKRRSTNVKVKNSELRLLLPFLKIDNKSEIYVLADVQTALHFAVSNIYNQDNRNEGDKRPS